MTNDEEDALIEEVSDVANMADNLLCATRLRVPDAVHVEGMRGGLIQLRDRLKAAILKIDPDYDGNFNFGYLEE